MSTAAAEEGSLRSERKPLVSACRTIRDRNRSAKDARCRALPFSSCWILDDDPSDAAIIARALGTLYPQATVEHLATREAFLSRLNSDPIDVVVSDSTVVGCGAVPILFQTARLHGKSSQEKVATYAAICKEYPQVLAFELSPRFASNGEIFDESTIRGLLEIPELKGMKHSSLDRLLELDRLALRDAQRPDFRIYTGNDLGINMIEYGSDYLLGLATFAPELFAERDRLWESGDARYYEISDALQHLGNVAFREPIAAYKHSAAIFLHLTGRISTDLPHPNSPRRPPWEAKILQDCVRRLGLSSVQ